MKDIVRLLVLLLLSNTLHKLIVSGMIAYYINPRFLPLTKAALIFIIILAVLSIIDLLVAVLKGKVNGSLHQTPIVVLLAFSTTLVFTPQAFSSSMVQQKGMLTFKNAPTEAANPERIGLENKDNTVVDEKPKQQELDMKAGQLARKDEVILLTDDNFIVKFAQIYRSPQTYAGKNIEMEGFIVHHPQIGNDKYLIVRYAMICCAADAQVLGFMVKGTSTFPDGSWVKITGKIAIEKDQPYLQLLDAKPGKEPNNPYLFAPERLPDS